MKISSVTFAHQYFYSHFHFFNSDLFSFKKSKKYSEFFQYPKKPLSIIFKIKQPIIKRENTPMIFQSISQTIKFIEPVL